MNWLLSRFAKTQDLFADSPGWYESDDVLDTSHALGAKLGAGSFASVFRLTLRRDGSVCAAKVFAKRGSLNDDNEICLPRSAELLREEVEVSELVGGQRHCVAFLGILETPTRLILRYELCRGSLADEIDGARGAEHARTWAHGLLDAVAWVHAQGVAHRDVKPENAMLSEDREVRLVDWGSARRTTGEPFPPGLDEVSGLWAAPELWRDAPSGAIADEWSCGMVVLALLEGEPAEGTVQALHLGGGGAHAYADSVHPDARALLSLLLAPDPEERLAAADALGHRWFLDASD